MILGDNITGRKNNLDLIRFLAAAMVIYAHAYPLVLGESGADPLVRFSDGQMSFGSLGVCILFLFSGFFITKSVLHKGSARDFFTARILRLFPPLIAVVLACVFVLGPLMTELPVDAYFSSSQTWKYLANICFVPVHELPGVFLQNPYDATVNGVFWTLLVEVFCYVACFLFGKMRLLDEKKMCFTIPIMAALYILGFVVFRDVPVLTARFRPCGMFYAGMLAYVYRNKIRLHPAGAAGGLALFLFGLRMGFLEQLLLLSLPYPLLFLAFGTKKKLDGFARHGEISYGMYLTAWPVAQCLVQWLGSEISIYIHVLLTFVLSVLFGLILCRLVEKPIQRLRK